MVAPVTSHTTSPASRSVKASLQQRVWRWHFFAGLIVVPFSIILAVTGAAYLFNPQYEAAVERSVNAHAVPRTGGDAPADELVANAMAAYPGASFVRMILPRSDEDLSAEVELRAADGLCMLWLDRTSGAVLRDVAATDRAMQFVKRIHGTLLGGNWGSLVVETIACWMIILVVTGIFLWWPRKIAWWRVFIPQFGVGGRRETWRKLHGMAGAWIGAVVLTLLLSGLPWTQVWGEGFTRAKALAGLPSPGQEWFVTLQSGDPHAHHGGASAGAEMWDVDAEAAIDVNSISSAHGESPLAMQDIVDRLAPEELAAPVWVQPPRGENGVWTVRAMSPHRPSQQTIHFDRWSGDEVMRIRFSDHNIADRIAALGVTFHEGALFGWLNQAVGVIAALGVILISVSGALMWWRRKPANRVGVPRMPADKRIAAGVVIVIAALGVFLPMAGATLLIALVADLLVSTIVRRDAAQS